MSDPPVSTLQVSLEHFTDLLDRCQWPLYTFLRGMVSDDEQARDLMQDTFYDAWRTAQQGNPPLDRASTEEAGMRSWLFHAAYNRACSALRRRRIISWLPLESSTWETGEDGSFESQIAESQVVRAASAHDTWPEYGEPVILHYSQGHWRPVPFPPDVESRLGCRATASGCPAIILRSVSMVSATDGWAVGNSVLPPNADGMTFGVVLHYTGGRWVFDRRHRQAVLRGGMRDEFKDDF